MNDSSSLGKISHGLEGLGTVTADLVQQRARELAKIDGRTDFNEIDLQQAQADLLDGAPEPIAPELEAAGMTEVPKWGEVDSEGVHAHRVAPEDEVSIAETLVNEGLDEADHNQRLEAAEENPPEEEE